MTNVKNLINKFENMNSQNEKAEKINKFLTAHGIPNGFYKIESIKQNRNGYIIKSIISDEYKPIKDTLYNKFLELISEDISKYSKTLGKKFDKELSNTFQKMMNENKLSNKEIDNITSFIDEANLRKNPNVKKVVSIESSSKVELKWDQKTHF